MKNQYLILATLCPMLGLGQPVFTSSDGELQIGDAVIYHLSNWTSAGPSGAGVTWDFSTLPDLATTSDTIVDPASTPYPTQYPTADAAEGTYMGWGYFTQSTSDLQSLGSANADTYVSLNDPWLRRSYPFTYGDTWADTFSGEGSGPSGSFTWNGSCSDTVDGWGTLLLPNGTFQDVLRLRSTAVYEEAFTNSQDTLIHVWETYEWLIPGTKKSLLNFHRNTATLNGNQVSDQFYSSWLDTVIVTTTMPEGIGSTVNFGCYPNPAVDIIYLQFSGSAEFAAPIVVCDAMGRRVTAKASSLLLEGNGITRVVLSIAHLEPGAYFVKLQREEKEARGWFIKE